MLWVDKEKSRCVKAWESVAPKLGSVNSVAFPRKGDYFVSATAGKLPRLFTDIIPPEMLAEAMLEWVELEGWQDLSFDQLSNTVEKAFQEYPKHVMDMVAEMEIVLVQQRLEGLEEVKRRKTVSLGNLLTPVTA